MKIRKVVTNSARLAAFSLLSLLRPVVVTGLEIITAFSLFGFIACAIFGQWFVFTVLLLAGVVASALTWSYDAILNRLVPFDYGFLSEG
ncbi:hypothetical protein CC202_09570 [Pseudomonas savastanoi]|uniref:hypothetical protein n=1 Tax=Pseudomonas savastanoi TaxID=29438 RepID=UPI000BA4A0E5|nr:hypothetical protein [Pseudomonas savastanoi]PAB33126.1 hypothetical protein CC202_09570 [Pseudomonas savastanoi]